MSRGDPRFTLRTILQRSLSLVSATALSVGVLAGAGAATVLPAIAEAAPSCSPAGSSGLTAAVVATTGQTISGMIDASGCDVGVYVGPDVHRVRITQATVQHANDHGIYVQDTSGVFIDNNNVVNNGIDPHACPESEGGPPTSPCVIENKAIQLTGTTGVIVRNNYVANNMADGGIAISDDGDLNPSGLNPGSLRAATDNAILNNTVVDNQVGCGIVVASYNAGAGVLRNVVSGNTVKRNPVGIVVAADVPNSVASYNTVVGNTTMDNQGPGVVIHSNTPGDVVNGNVVTWNTISGNAGFGPGTWGIAVLGEVTPPTNTMLWFNMIDNEDIGVFEKNTVNTTIVDGGLNHATQPVVTASP